MADGSYEACVAACNACADACDHCLSSCLLEPDAADMVRCIAIDLECSVLCRAMAGFAARGSKFAPGLATMCAELCVACAEECGAHARKHCQLCVIACRQCALACRALAGLGITAPATHPL